ncbi:MAG TPA: alanine racemase [Bacillus sp. (in: firmicutes)]|uniref:alanine racemase n=1 Tax=Bacillus litorisediminis TaxID=2922713 RepID=UPI001FAC5633|nr:alanine racemase [Bacillus litorisediminis]HWO76784.1 alanine racemase [Bacillus sp. (in: firmicutes)]
MGFLRDTWAEINLDAIKWNVQKMREFLSDDVQIMAVVKANAYGHGDVEVAQIALESGASMVAVAILDEAIALRQKGIQAPILVLGASRPENAVLAAEHDISLTVFQKDWLIRAKKLLDTHQLKIHIKCDTGMGRLGVRLFEELNELVQTVRQSPQFIWEGMYTHFATADQTDEHYFQKQLSLFDTWVEQLDNKPPIIHASNSAAALKQHIKKFNAVRMGISMYGLAPSPEIKPLLPFDLKPAMSLYSKIVHIKRVEKGSAISYGNAYIAEDDEWIATLPIGYADGWIRKNQGFDVSVEGIRVPIVGRVCMDQCMIKLPAYYPEGTKVCLIGQDVTIDEVAERLDTINYEVACMISSRVPRVYIKDDQIIAIKNIILDQTP